MRYLPTQQKLFLVIFLSNRYGEYVNFFYFIGVMPKWNSCTDIHIDMIGVICKYYMGRYMKVAIVYKN